MSALVKFSILVLCFSHFLCSFLCDFSQLISPTVSPSPRVLAAAAIIDRPRLEGREMEVAPPPPPQAVDFNLDSACSSPYITAPSSPRRSGGGFFSASTTPRLSSAFFHRLNSLSLLPSGGGAADEALSPARSGTRVPPSYNFGDDEELGVGEFEFDFSGQLDRAYALSADELFDGGKIKPLGANYAADLGNSTRNFGQLRDEPRKEPESRGGDPKQSHRGRSERFVSPSSASSISSARKGSRSLSPFRVSDLSFDGEESSRKASNRRKPPSTSPSSSANSSSSVSSSMASAAAAASSKGSKKWKLRDFLLFRSASEGRASTSGKDPLRKYYSPLLSKKKGEEEEAKGASFRSTESVSGSSRRRSGPGPVRSSAHELHYKANRAVSEEMRRKTFLPYKQDLLGCLGFNSVSAVHEISRGIGSLTRG